MNTNEKELNGFIIYDVGDEFSDKTRWADDIEKEISPDYEEFLLEEELIFDEEDDDVSDLYEDLDGWDSPLRWDED